LSYYLMLDLLVLAAPLALSFDRKVAFHRKWPAVFAAIAAIVLSFGAWDVWKTAIGVWSFNSEYAGTIRWLGLPPAEWFFFVAIPYACIFILACIRAYLRDAELKAVRAYWLVLAAVFALPAPFVLDRTYTAVVLVSAALTLVLGALASPATLRSRNTWIALGITYVPFVLANGILTGKPVVLYDDARNLGVRVGTIPVEDFVFSFSMLLASFVLYDIFGTAYARLRGRKAGGAS